MSSYRIKIINSPSSQSLERLVNEFLENYDLWHYMEENKESRINKGEKVLTDCHVEIKQFDSGKNKLYQACIQMKGYNLLPEDYEDTRTIAKKYKEALLDCLDIEDKAEFFKEKVISLISSAGAGFPDAYIGEENFSVINAEYSPSHFYRIKFFDRSHITLMPENFEEQGFLLGQDF